MLIDLLKALNFGVTCIMFNGELLLVNPHTEQIKPIPAEYKNLFTVWTLEQLTALSGRLPH